MAAPVRPGRDSEFQKDCQSFSRNGSWRLMTTSTLACRDRCPVRSPFGGGQAWEQREEGVSKERRSRGHPTGAPRQGQRGQGTQAGPLKIRPLV